MYKEMTKTLQDDIISALAELDNTSLSSLKNVAKRYGVDISQVLTIHKRNKGRIISLKNSTKVKLPSVTETVSRTGSEYMIIRELPHPEKPSTQTNTEPKFVWTRTKQDQEHMKRLIDDEKLFIADKIEKAATNIDGTKYITKSELGKLADKYFVSVCSLITYMKEYTSVKMDHSFYANYVSPRRIPKEIVDQIIDDLKTTTLSQREIAEFANVSTFVVSKLKTNNNIERPKEDEEVKRKNKVRRAKLQNKNKASSTNKNNTTVNKEEAVTVEEKVREPIIKQEKETVTTEEPVTETVVTVDTTIIPGKPEAETVEESDTRKPGIYTQTILRNNAKNINKITSPSPVFECVLVTKRHSTPLVKGVFEECLDKVTMFDYDKQLHICENFLKKYLRFDSEGRANKSVKMYCTGLQSPLVSFIIACNNLKVNLTFLHYDNDTCNYHEQKYSTNNPTYQEAGVGVTAIYRTFGNFIYRYKCSVMKDIEQSTNCLYVIVCNENAHNPAKKTSAAIVCKSVADYKELFMSIVSTMIGMKPADFSVEVRKFNFDTEGNVIKNSLESYYEIK
jgi:hypothetical protein